MSLGSKLAPPQGYKLEHKNKEGRIHFVGKMTQASDPGPSWPSCTVYTTLALIHGNACLLRALTAMIVCELYWWIPYVGTEQLPLTKQECSRSVPINPFPNDKF